VGFSPTRIEVPAETAAALFTSGSTQRAAHPDLVEWVATLAPGYGDALTYAGFSAYASTPRAVKSAIRAAVDSANKAANTAYRVKFTSDDDLTARKLDPAAILGMRLLGPATARPPKGQGKRALAKAAAAAAALATAARANNGTSTEKVPAAAGAGAAA
jgi:hypothetical protein